MRKLLNPSVVMILLISLLALGLPVESTSANDEGKSGADSEDDFRVTVPVPEEKKQATRELIKNSMLNKKLVKMGRAKSQGCTRCHGRSGMQSLAESNGWPESIAEFVAVQLTAFRDGKRSHEIMSSIAKPMSDQDIALVALWYQSVSAPVSAD